MLVVDAISDLAGGHIGLPGPDTKNWWLNLGAQGLLTLLNSFENRRARYICQIGIYYGAGNYSYHAAELEGYIAHEMRTTESAFRDFPETNPYFFHSVFALAADGPTLAELDGPSFTAVDYRRKCFKKVAQEAARFDQPAARGQSIQHTLFD
jgi:inosine/xanthosine triphosphate pyrophosphatase family protein